MYEKYKDEDLISAYSTMMATSNTISSDLANVIQNRGGLEYFKRILELRKKQPDEFARLKKEIHALTSPDTNFELVRKLISSKYLSVEDLNIFVKRVFEEQRASQVDKAVTKTTFVKNLIGLVAGSAAGTLFWLAILYVFKQPFIFVMPVVFIIGYFIIKFISGQSFKNPVVLVASLFSAFISLVAGHFLFINFFH